MNAQRVTMVAALSAGLMHLARLAMSTEDTEASDYWRVILATFVLVAILMLVAEFYPNGARGLAVLLLVTSVLINGVPVIQGINKLIEGE